MDLLEFAYRNGMTESGEVYVVEVRWPDGPSRRFAFGVVTTQAFHHEKPNEHEPGTHEGPSEIHARFLAGELDKIPL